MFEEPERSVKFGRLINMGLLSFEQVPRCNFELLEKRGRMNCTFKNGFSCGDI